MHEKERKKAVFFGRKSPPFDQENVTVFTLKKNSLACSMSRFLWMGFTRSFFMEQFFFVLGKVWYTQRDTFMIHRSVCGSIAFSSRVRALHRL